MPTRKARPNEGHPTAVDACLTIETVDAAPVCPSCEGDGEVPVFDGQCTIQFPCPSCNTYWEGPNS